MIIDTILETDVAGRFPMLPYGPGDRIIFHYGGKELAGEISGISVVMPANKIYIGVQIDPKKDSVEITPLNIIRILKYEEA